MQENIKTESGIEVDADGVVVSNSKAVSVISDFRSLVFAEETAKQADGIEYIHVRTFLSLNSAGFRINGNEVAKTVNATFVFAKSVNAALFTKTGETPVLEDWVALVFINNQNAQVWTTWMHGRSIGEFKGWLNAQNAKKKKPDEVSPAVGSSVQLIFGKDTTKIPKLIDGVMKTSTYHYLMWSAVDSESFYKQQAIDLYMGIKTKTVNLPKFN